MTNFDAHPIDVCTAKVPRGRVRSPSPLTGEGRGEGDKIPMRRIFPLTLTLPRRWGGYIGDAKVNRQAPTHKKGSVLLVTVFLIAFGALLVGGLLLALTSDLQIVKNHLYSTKALYVADAGIEDAIAALRSDYTWDSGFTQKPFPAGSTSHYTVSVVNTHPTVVLTSTGVAAGLERTVEVKVIVAEMSAPYPTRVLYWKEP